MVLMYKVLPVNSFPIKQTGLQLEMNYSNFYSLSNSCGFKCVRFFSFNTFHNLFEDWQTMAYLKFESTSFMVSLEKIAYIMPLMLLFALSSLICKFLL